MWICIKLNAIENTKVRQHFFLKKRHADNIDLLRGAEKKTREMATTFMLNSGFENGVFQAFRGLKSHFRIIKI